MTTTYGDGSYGYSAQLSDGVTSGSTGFNVSANDPVPESVFDAAAQAFFEVINSYIPVVSSTKIVAASGTTDWAFVPSQAPQEG